MNAKELIASGVIELYCLGIASEEEKFLVDEMSKHDQSVVKEIFSVNDALAKYSIATPSIQPRMQLKEKILDSIRSGNQNGKEKSLPPKLTSQSTIEEWLSYLDHQDIREPENYDGIVFIELPGTEDYYTYAVFAKEGACVPEEEHHAHNEFLLICSGECEMTIGGKKSFHKSGDFLEIHPGIPHSALITGKDHMIVIGQRRAA